MAKAIVYIGPLKRVQYRVLENVTQVYLDPGKYSRFSDKTDLYICTMTGETYVAEGMNVKSAMQYMTQFAMYGCLDLTKTVDAWVYIVRIV